MLLADYGEFQEYDFELWTSEREVGSKLLILPNLPNGELPNPLPEVVREIAEMSRLLYPVSVFFERDHRHYVALLDEDGELTEGFLKREVEDVEERLEHP